MNHFDNLIEEAAVLPRRYCHAPKTEDMFPNKSAREAARPSSSRPWMSRVLATSPLTSGSGLPLNTSL